MARWVTTGAPGRADLTLFNAAPFRDGTHIPTPAAYATDARRLDA